MKAIALALLLAQPVYVAPDPPPDVYGALVWRHGELEAPGYWFTAAQVQRINLRLDYLEDRATRDCIRSTNEANKKLLGTTPALWISVSAALVVGVLGGVYLAHHF